MVGLKTATAVGLLFSIGQIWLSYAIDTNDLKGCECNILGACDANGNRKQDWNKYLPLGVDKFGYVVQNVQNLRYVCEDPESPAILFDNNSKIPLYCAIVMNEQQLNAEGKQKRNKRFRLSKKLAKDKQQRNKDYKGSSKRELCIKKVAQKAKTVAKKWLLQKQAPRARKGTVEINNCFPFEDLKTEVHRGHLCASQYGRGNQKRMDATNTYTNVVPQFGAFNSGPWQQCESRLVRWGQTECAMKGAKNVRMHIVVGAIPSTVYGASEATFFGVDGFSELQQKTDYPVNFPKYLWTAACCTFETNVQDIDTKAVAFKRENDPGNSPCEVMGLPKLTTFLANNNIPGKIDLFPNNPECNNLKNYRALTC